PALAGTRTDPSDALRARSDAAGRVGARWRGVLVSAEMALAVVLVAGAGLMVKTLWRLGHVDPGFQAEHALTFRLQPTGKSTQQLREYFKSVVEEVRALPGVQTVGGIHHLPMSGYNWWADIEVEGRPVSPGEAPVRGGWRIIEGDYMRTMGIRMISGRSFMATDVATTERVALINDVLARRLFPGEDALGRRFRAGNATRGEWVRVIGVVAGVRHQAVELEPDPEMYFPLGQVAMSFLNIVVRTTVDPLSIAEAARQKVRGLDPAVPIAGMRALTAVVSESSARQRLVLRLLAAFATIGLLLAAIGVYAVVAFGVTQRRHEIGVRSALGARRQQIVALILRQGLGHTLAGLAVGIPAAFALTRTMRGVVYGVSTADPLTYVIVAVVLLVAAVLASWIPARRAAALNPVAVLKGD
ncbi:MAG: FtsX-like permease family protein, partial [Gemmatimonadota bacterium]